MSTAEAVTVANPRARRRRLLRKRFLRRPVAVASLLVILAFIVIAVFAPLVAPYSESKTDFDTLLAKPSGEHLFGTDELGRDVFSRVVWGARVSITVGFLATGLSLLIAVPIGLLAGYYRGWFDSVVARVTDVLLALPFVIFAIGLAAIMGPSLTTTTVALGIAGVPGLVRITRGEALALREADFVPAAVASGAGDRTIVFRHILPNMSSTLLVWITVHIPRAIIGEATLSFLGVGIRPPAASWGRMLHDAQSYLTQAPRLAVYPGLAIVIAALAFNLLGDALRDILDPRTTR
jgi:ABC-type dipeptide/oligopeptide/nickel transport system permease subunit